MVKYFDPTLILERFFALKKRVLTSQNQINLEAKSCALSV